MKNIIIYCSCLLLTVLFSCAKEETTGTLKITVMNGNLIPMDGRSVTITDVNDNTTYSETTDSDAIAWFQDIEPGSYQVNASGFVFSDNVTLSAGQTLNQTVIIP